ncbi:MAG: metalloregulator ArsR/SmtB family transcription factor, partial [Planctomycetota bacterium]
MNGLIARMLTAARTSSPDALLGWMGSLSDPTRLRLLRLLEREELGVVDLCDVLQMPQSTVSRHLKMLSDQGWLRSRRRGTTRLYRTVLDELEVPARELWLVARGQTDAWPTTRQDALRLKTRLSERNAAAKQFFSGKAGEWDRLRGEYYGAGWETAALLALLPADYVVADLGCGTGSTLCAIAPNVHTAIGVDNNTQMLKAAAKRCGDHDNVDLRTGELENLPLADGEANAAVLSLVLGYLDEPADVLAEMARVIEPGGKAVIVDLLPHNRDDIRDQLG